MPIVAVILSFFLNRAKEPSTHAGIAALAQALAFFVPPLWQPVVEPLANAATAIFGVLAVTIREKAEPLP